MRSSARSWLAALLAVALFAQLLPGCGATLRRIPRQSTISTDEAVLPVALCGDYFLVQATIDGHGPFSLLLDTGAEATMVGPHVAEAVRGRARRANVRVIGAERGVERARGLLRIGELRAGPFAIGGFDAVVLDLGRFSAAVGVPVDGVLGFPAFDGALLTLDYPRRQVRVSRGRLEPDATEVLEYRGRWTPIVDLRLAERAEPVLIDSGMSGSIRLRSLAGLDFATPPRPIESAVALGGTKTAHLGRLSGTAQLGPKRLSEPMAGPTAGPARVGTVVLRHYTITFDQRTRRVRLTPEGHEPIEFAPIRGIGAAFGRDWDAWVVREVFPEGPARSAGLAVGDVVTAVNGEPVAAWGCNRWRRLLDSSPRVELSLARDGDSSVVAVPVVELVP